MDAKDEALRASLSVYKLLFTLTFLYNLFITLPCFAVNVSELSPKMFIWSSVIIRPMFVSVHLDMFQQS